MGKPAVGFGFDRINNLLDLNGFFSLFLVKLTHVAFYCVHLPLACNFILSASGRISLSGLLSSMTARTESVILKMLLCPISRSDFQCYVLVFVEYIIVPCGAFACQI